MGGRAWLALAAASASALLESCRAGVKPTVFLSSTQYHGGADKNDVTFTFHLSEAPGGTAGCTGSPKYTSEVGQMTDALTLSEDASLIENFYAGWTITTETPTGSASLIETYNPLTRVITIKTGDPVDGIVTSSSTTYQLTAGTCGDQFTSKQTARSVNGMWLDCPEGCEFVGPIVDAQGYQAFVSGPIPCTTVGDGGTVTTTLLCPKNTVAAATQPLAGISIKRQMVATTAALGAAESAAAAAGQSFEIRDTVVTGTMSAALTLTSSEDNTANYYAGWKIATEFPKASGTILTSDTSNAPVITVAWDEPETCDTGFDLGTTTCTPVTTSDATDFVLTADCPAAPKNVPLLTQTVSDGSSPFQYQFKPGSLTSWDPVAASEALDFAKCTVARSADGIWSARVPAGAFTDAGGNPNVASTACTGLTSTVSSAYDPTSGYTAAETADGVAMCNQDEPYLVTSDITVPSVTVTASDDNWHSSISTGALANGDRITFKFVLSEPPIKTSSAKAFVLPSGSSADGDLDTTVNSNAGHQCKGPVSWGSVRSAGAPMHAPRLQSCHPARTYCCLLRVCRRALCTTFGATPSPREEQHPQRQLTARYR